MSAPDLGDPADICLIVATRAGVILAALGDATVCGWQPDKLVGESIATALVPERYREAHVEGMITYRFTGKGPVLGRCLPIEARGPEGDEYPVWLTVFGYEEFSGLLFGLMQRRDSTGSAGCGALA